MPRGLIVALCLASVAGGCGQETEAAFDAQFDETFRSSCVSAATQGGAPAQVATRACDCTLAKINAKYDAQAKVNLSQEQAQPIVDECLAEAVKP